MSQAYFLFTYLQLKTKPNRTNPNVCMGGIQMGKDVGNKNKLQCAVRTPPEEKQIKLIKTEKMRNEKGNNYLRDMYIFWISLVLFMILLY